MESVLPISTKMPGTSLKKNDGKRTRRVGKCLPTRQLCIIRSSTIDEVVSVAQPTSSWQITIGALGGNFVHSSRESSASSSSSAGVTPFIIAGIAFSQRIVAQKKCSVCKGSGLVQRDKYYFRCSNCGSSQVKKIHCQDYEGRQWFFFNLQFNFQFPRGQFSRFVVRVLCISFIRRNTFVSMIKLEEAHESAVELSGQF